MLVVVTRNSNIYFVPIGVRSCYQRFLFVCLSVLMSSLLARISQKPRVQISLNFLHMLPVAVARSSSDGNAIRYVLPVLWMTSFSHNTENGQNQRRRVCFVEFARWRHRVRSLPSLTTSYFSWLLFYILYYLKYFCVLTTDISN